MAGRPAELPAHTAQSRSRHSQALPCSRAGGPLCDESQPCYHALYWPAACNQGPPAGLTSIAAEVGEAQGHHLSLQNACDHALGSGGDSPVDAHHADAIPRLAGVHQVVLHQHVCAAGQLARRGSLWQLLPGRGLCEHAGAAAAVCWGMQQQGSYLVKAGACLARAVFGGVVARASTMVQPAMSAAAACC